MPIDRLDEVMSYPLDSVAFEERAATLCEEFRNKLRQEWMCTCADLFLTMKDAWRNLVPREKEDSDAIIHQFFRCINSLMALMLRKLVWRSLKHYIEFLEKYKVSS